MSEASPRLAHQQQFIKINRNYLLVHSFFRWSCVVHIGHNKRRHHRSETLLLCLPAVDRLTVVGRGGHQQLGDLLLNGLIMEWEEYYVHM